MFISGGTLTLPSQGRRDKDCFDICMWKSSLWKSGYFSYLCTIKCNWLKPIYPLIMTNTWHFFPIGLAWSYIPSNAGICRPHRWWSQWTPAFIQAWAHRQNTLLTISGLLLTYSRKWLAFSYQPLFSVFEPFCLSHVCLFSLSFIFSQCLFK